MIVGIARIELHVPEAQSLKDKRSVIKSLKERARGRFNIAIAEVEANEKWQWACLGVATVADDRRGAESGVRAVVEWIRSNPMVSLIRVEEEIL